jgi:hypothetical protein
LGKRGQATFDGLRGNVDGAETEAVGRNTGDRRE